MGGTGIEISERADWEMFGTEPIPVNFLTSD
jgi:hypothetical protein